MGFINTHDCQATHRSQTTAQGFHLAVDAGAAGGGYFDYSFDREPSHPPGPGSGIGGTPGFVVADDGIVREIGWVELRTARESAAGDSGNDERGHSLFKPQ